jgi:hypothetical protein
MWKPVYTADFSKRLVYQMVAFLQRDLPSALAWVASTDQEPPLPNIVTYQTAPYTIPQYPALLVVPADTSFDPDSVGTRAGSYEFLVAAAVAHQDAGVCAALVQDYVRALDAVLMSIDIADFALPWPITLPFTTQTVTIPCTYGTVKELFVGRHNYDDVRRQKDRFACAATLEVHIDREEA